MIYEDLEEEGIRCIEAVRERFDGARRNPFDEPECGHHYARSMASWSAVLALSGFHYSAVNKEFCITSRPGTWFWSNGSAWGTVTVTTSGATLQVIEGTVAVDRFRCGSRSVKMNTCMGPGTVRTVRF